MQSRGAAGRDRISDVYVGVDVFGRSCFGGGGYNCDKVQCLYFDLFFFQGLMSWTQQALGGTTGIVEMQECLTAVFH